MTLKLTNGGLNLHTPTTAVCKKINEVEDGNCMQLTDRKKEMRVQETGSKRKVAPSAIKGWALITRSVVRQGTVFLRIRLLFRTMLFSSVYSTTSAACARVIQPNCEQCYFEMKSLC